MADNNTPHELPPLHGAALILTTFAVSLATFMNVLDMTVANVSIPAISGDLGASPSQGTWVITSFAVANAISVPLTGWLTQRFGTVRLFVTSLLLFVLASLACGLSSNLQSLVLFRALQGAVAGPMIPVSQALLLQSFPRAKAGIALAAWGMTGLVAPIMGPLLGGWISDNISWPWIFYINIPAGLIAAAMTWRLLRHRESPTVKNPVDGIGLGLLVLWVGALQILLDKGKALDWFGSGEIRLLAAVSAAAFCFFIIWELTEEHPVVDLSLFRSRNFTVGAITAGMGFCLYFGGVVIVPLWAQQFLGYTALWAGLVTAPGGLIAMMLTPSIGRLLPKVDPRLIACLAFLLFSATSFMRMGFTLDSTPWMIILPQLVLGAAMGIFFIPMTALILSDLHPSRFAAAAGLSISLRMILTGIGVSITTTMWDNRASLHHAQLVERVSVYDQPARQAIDTLSAQGMPHDQIMGLLEQQITAQSYMLSTTEYFYLVGFLLLLLAAAVWLAKPKGHGATPPADAGH